LPRSPVALRIGPLRRTGHGREAAALRWAHASPPRRRRPVGPARELHASARGAAAGPPAPRVPGGALRPPRPAPDRQDHRDAGVRRAAAGPGDGLRLCHAGDEPEHARQRGRRAAVALDLERGRRGGLSAEACPPDPSVVATQPPGGRLRSWLRTWAQQVRPRPLGCSWKRPTWCRARPWWTCCAGSARASRGSSARVEDPHVQPGGGRELGRERPLPLRPQHGGDAEVCGPRARRRHVPWPSRRARSRAAYHTV
jgi:hypothetical protein